MTDWPRDTLRKQYFFFFDSHLKSCLVLLLRSHCPPRPTFSLHRRLSALLFVQPRFAHLLQPRLLDLFHLYDRYGFLLKLLSQYQLCQLLWCCCFLTLTDPLRIQPWSQDGRNQTKSNRQSEMSMESRQKKDGLEVASKGHRRDKIENINKKHTDSRNKLEPTA